jgi:hypothetical protein
MKGIIASNTGLLKTYFKVQENDEENKQTTLSKEISRHSFVVSTKLDSEDKTDSLVKLTSSLTLLAQAQSLVGKDNREARKLYNQARRLSR